MALGSHWVTFQHGHNPAAVYKAANSDSRRIGTRDTWTEQVSCTLKWLLGNLDKGKLQTRRIATLRDTDEETSEGLVFGTFSM